MPKMSRAVGGWDILGRQETLDEIGR